MGFSISGGGADWLGILVALLAIPAIGIVLFIFITAAKQARDTVVDEDERGDGPIA